MNIFLHMNKFKLWGYCMCFVKLIKFFLPVLCWTQPYACWKMGLGWDSMLQCPWKMLHSKKKNKTTCIPYRVSLSQVFPTDFCCRIYRTLSLNQLPFICIIRFKLYTVVKIACPWTCGTEKTDSLIFKEVSEFLNSI